MGDCELAERAIAIVWRYAVQQLFFVRHSSGNSTLLPAYGHVSMGAGSGSQAVQVNQNFPGDNNHMRSDMTRLCAVGVQQ